MERIRGSVNIPLSPEGKKQAKELADKVLAGGGMDEMHSSSLARAKETANAVAAASGVQNHPDKNLHPWHLGGLEGEEVNPTTTKEMNYYVEHPEKVPSGKHEDSTEPPESFNAFKIRVLHRLRALTRKAKEENKKIGVVGHFRTFRLWESHIKAGAKPDLSIHTPNMTKAPDGAEETGHMAQISDASGKLMFKPLDKPHKYEAGVYLMRHGKTAWNR